MLIEIVIENEFCPFSSTANLHYEKFSDGTVKRIQKEIPFKIPANWGWTRFRNIIVNDKGGGTPNKSNPKYWGGSIQWMSVKDFSGAKNGVIVDTIDHVTQEGVNNSSTNIIDTSAIILCTRMGLGKYAKLAHPTAINQDLRAIWLSKNIHENYFLAFYSTLNIDGNGTTVEGIKKEQLLNTLIPIPPFKEQARIANIQKTSFSEIEIIENQKIALCELINNTKSKILDLAIRGKLVSQDPNDEPASELLERIQHEKEELIKAGKLKRDKRESVIFRGEDNSYYLRTGKLVEPLTDWSFDDLPKNWEICCFGEICNYGDCINTESSVIENSAWILDLEDIEKDTGRIVSRVSKADRPSISTKHKFHKGQVLYSKLRPYLNKVVLADRDGYCTSEILPLEFHAKIIPEYARYYLMSPTFLRYADKCSYGVKMPRLGTNDGKKAIFPLPPINEQRRIVKQIELMFSHLSGIEISVQ